MKYVLLILILLFTVVAQYQVQKIYYFYYDDRPKIKNEYDVDDIIPYKTIFDHGRFVMDM